MNSHTLRVHWNLVLMGASVRVGQEEGTDTRTVCMLCCPIRIHLQNASSKEKHLRISK